MPSGCHNKLLKSYNEDRRVECGKCGQHMSETNRRTLGYPKNVSNPMTVKYYELDNGKAIKTKSIFAMFGGRNEESLVSI